MNLRLREHWQQIVVAALACLVAVGALLLWPTGDPPGTQAQSQGAERGEVVGSGSISCRSQATSCRRVDVEVLTGPRAGSITQIRTGDSLSDPRPEIGDELRIVRNDVPAGTPSGAIDEYAITDFERRMPLLWLAMIFVTVVLAVGRARGARALLGLAGSVVVVFGFVVPAILDGRSPGAVALVGAMAIMLVTVVVTHGPGPKAVAAILGTTASLGVTVGLGAAFVELAHLTGLSSDASTLLLVGREDLALEGIVLAGLVIGALGVLDDVTVSQASTVLALRRANMTLGVRELYRRGLAVGQDHASATVNTLVLAYVGSALPVLLVFSGGGVGFGDAINSEPVAEQLVAMLAGSVGLMTAVPLTTALAAWLAVRLRADELTEEHGHLH